MAASDTPEARPLNDFRGKTFSRPPAPAGGPILPPTRVSTDVSSVAIDRGLLDRGLLSRGIPDRGRLNFAGTPSPSAPDTMANSAVSSDDAVSDVDMMLRVKTGDESAFAYLVQKYRRPMVGFMYRMCHNPSTAEELAQEVFLRVYRSRTN